MSSTFDGQGDDSYESFDLYATIEASVDSDLGFPHYFSDAIEFFSEVGLLTLEQIDELSLCQSDDDIFDIGSDPTSEAGVVSLWVHWAASQREATELLYGATDAAVDFFDDIGELIILDPRGAIEWCGATAEFCEIEFDDFTKARIQLQVNSILEVES